MAVTITFASTLRARHTREKGRLCYCRRCALKRAAAAMAEIRQVFIEGNDWKELQSCADAVQDVSLILSAHGFGPLGGKVGA